MLRLRIKALLQFICEVECFPSAKRRSDSTLVQNLDVPILSLPMREAEITFEPLLHCDIPLVTRTLPSSIGMLKGPGNLN